MAVKLYHTTEGILIESGGNRHLATGLEWDEWINDDDLLAKATATMAGASLYNKPLPDILLPPIGARQELWACGVTYLRSKVGREEESKTSGGADFYGRVYTAERPEVFFKANPHRVVGQGTPVRIRKDSSWNVPEPELTLLVSSSGKITGYTIGNDMSSRSIEGENPLYLPQAKTYDGCAALGPCIYVPEQPPGPDTRISLQISRNKVIVFEGEVTLQQMKRKPEDLVAYVFRECSFPVGCLVMTGTGIVPPNDFSLAGGDEIAIAIDGIGTLVNRVA